MTTKALDTELHVNKEPYTPDMEEAVTSIRKELEEFEHYKNNPDIHEFYGNDDIVRFLRARNFDIPKTVTMIFEECEWRATYKPHLIKAEEIEPEICTGKNRLASSPDAHGRPVIVMHPKYENTATHDRQIRLMIWQLEMARKLMVDPVAKYCVVINMENIGVFNNPTPSHVSKEVAKCLSGRYPERLDARTKSKIKFMPSTIKEGSDEEAQMVEILGSNWKKLIGLDAEQVDKTIAPGYDHETYWPRVLAFEQTNQGFYVSLETDKSEENAEPIQNKPQDETEVTENKPEDDIAESKALNQPEQKVSHDVLSEDQSVVIEKESIITADMTEETQNISTIE